MAYDQDKLIKIATAIESGNGWINWEKEVAEVLRKCIEVKSSDYDLVSEDIRLTGSAWFRVTSDGSTRIDPSRIYLRPNEYRDDLVIAIERLQKNERCAAAIIPYPGGVIAFGSREAVLDMLKHAGDDDGGR